MLMLLFYPGEMLLLTLESSRLAVLSVQSATGIKNKCNLITEDYLCMISVGEKKCYTHSNFRCDCSELNIVKCEGVVCVGQAHRILRETSDKQSIDIRTDTDGNNTPGM